MPLLALCPSRGRPGAAGELLASFLETRHDPASRLVFLVDSDDPTAPEYPPEHTRIVPPAGSMGGALREAVQAGLLGDATTVGMVGDDCRFRTPGWDVTLDTWLTAQRGIAWGDDGWDHPWPKTEKASHWWLSRPIVDAMGMCHPGQRHWYMDDYWAQLGWATGCARYFPDILIEHLHPMAKKASMDATYSRAVGLLRADKAWWAQWQRRWKAQDIRRLRAIVGAGRPLRVFADWHHPALWEALSIVFEDRFGWALYSPIGAEWKRHGWTMRNATPGWEADDYLVFPDAVERDGHWTRTEPEYPDRPRKMVTVGQFQAQPWDIIVASVGPHQRTFHELARRKGARYVHHVGDAKRQLMRLRGQVVIASARARADVIHHQEFSGALFGPAPITERLAVSSLMLRLDSTSGPYEWLAKASGIRWSAVHAQSPHDKGYLAPMSKVAQRMRRSGWVWHDKRVGDGYGHVLFTAAAMGRPLIGHASHYRGLMGEALWDDLKTCIDLDRHEPREALRLLRAIAAEPEWHDEMGSAIRARFEQLVDFDAEAERIRAALT